jgi:hypothetical protein
LFKIDNFLDEKIFNNIRDIIISNKLPYYVQEDLLYNLFTHILVNENQEIISNAFDSIGKPIVDRIKKMDPYFSKLLRMKVNCYPNQSKPIKSEYHIDLANNLGYKTFILGMNDTNGYTEFEYKKMPKCKSLANVAYVFNGNEKHRSVSQTNTAYRWNININYETNKLLSPDIPRHPEFISR